MLLTEVNTLLTRFLVEEVMPISQLVDLLGLEHKYSPAQETS